MTTPAETTVEPSQPLSATVTLIPFPTITLLFPDTPVPATVQALQAPERSSETDGSSSSSGMARYTPLAFVLLIWLLLGVWFYFSSRQIK